MNPLRDMIRWADPHLRRLVRDVDGNVATITAIVAVPMMVVTGGLIDYTEVANSRAQLQRAIDNAVIAGVVDQTTSRDQVALKQFNANYSDGTATLLGVTT